MARIMVVDDEVEIRNLLRRSLERAGHEVCEARNGAEALRLQKTSPADVVITDILMPDKDGVEVIGGLRLESPEINVIAMSGGGRFNQIQALDIAEHLGAFATFRKPFDFRTMVAAVERALIASGVRGSVPVAKGT